MRTETKEDFERAISETKSMTAAAKVLAMSYDTFKRKAKEYGVFSTNQAGQGLKKGKHFKSREDIFRVFDYQVGRHSVKKWYLYENEYKCELCGISEWQGKELTIELDHINGNSKDNRIENLRLLCPNCHSQTETWRRKK